MATKDGLYDAGNGILVNFETQLVQGYPVYVGFSGGENVAVKVVQQGGSEFNRKEREITNMIDLISHTNTVQYKASSTTKNPPNCFIAMEMCRPDTLDNAIIEGKLTPHGKKIVLQHIVNGLQHMHQQKVVHAKLEPRHILQSLDGHHAKICGFALSRVHGNSRLTISTGSSIGDWGSPEVLKEKEVNEKSDVYSAGLIFHYVLSDGKHPFGNDSFTRKYNIRKGKEAKLNLKEYPLGAIAVNLIQEMLSFEQKDRPTTLEVLKHPFFWDEDRQKGCAEIVKSLGPEALQIILRDHDVVNELDGAILLYILWRKGGQTVEIPTPLDQGFKEMIRPGLPTYKELVNVKFGSHESPTVKQNISRAVAAVAQDPTGEIVDTETCKIYVKKPYKRGKLVFPAEMKGVVEDQAAVKIVRNTDEVRRSLTILQETKNHENMVGVKRIFEIKTGANIPGLELRSEETAICVAMELCGKVLTDILASNPSAEYRKMLALQLIHALDFLQGKKFTHGRITTDKLILSKDGRNLRLLGSRESSRLANETAQHGDILAAADALKIIVGRESQQRDKILDVELFDDLYDKMAAWATASEILIHPFFWKPNKKLDFLVAVGDHFDARNYNPDLEERIRECCDKEHWSDALTMTDEEKQQWFSTDDDGIVYQKATAMKNKTVPKYDTTSRVWLVRFIRNCANHLLDDCEKERQDNDDTEQQTLFRTRKDIWKFFSSRYPKLFHHVYTFIQNSELRDTHRFARYFTESAEKTALDKVE